MDMKTSYIGAPPVVTPPNAVVHRAAVLKSIRNTPPDMQVLNQIETRYQSAAGEQIASVTHAPGNETLEHWTNTWASVYDSKTAAQPPV